jgi:hypothetical protein
MQRSWITHFGRISLPILAAAYLGACGPSELSERGTGETTPEVSTTSNPLEVCVHAGEVLGESVSVLLFSTEAADPRSQSLDATPAGTDCSVIRGNGSVAQLFVPDNGEPPFFHEVSP